MFDNLMNIAAIVSVMWMGLIGFYVYTSRQQKEIREDIEALEELLDNE